MPFKDPERRRQYGRDWMRRNADKARAAMRRWRARHPDKHNADSRSYYARHREYIVARSVAYHRANPEIGRTVDAKRRAQKAGAGGTHTSEHWSALVESYGGRCAYCGGDGPLQRDHRIPLCRGGTNLIENIAPACRSCNMHKHRMTDREWMVRLLNARLKSAEFEVVDWWAAREIEWVS